MLLFEEKKMLFKILILSTVELQTSQQKEKERENEYKSYGHPFRVVNIYVVLSSTHIFMYKTLFP